jgi:hypothetical protein
MPLDREEYVEQAYLFRALADRMPQQMAVQDLLVSIRDELLATTKLPLAVDFMAGELKLMGVFATAMAKLGHYFTPFQTYVVAEAENERSRFDFSVALEILFHEAAYRAGNATPQGIFLYQFEVLCRNRLGYDKGLAAIAGDPIFDAAWREWLDIVRRQIGLIDLSDMVYVRSQYYARTRNDPAVEGKPPLFGEKEGRIAWANRQKDPLLLFSALQRHLGYPVVPRPKPPDESKTVIPNLLRRLDRVEARLRLLEEEQKGGIDLSKFMGPQAGPDTP